VVHYVPRAATEHALARLREGLRIPGTVSALCGPTGIGKSRALEQLPARLDHRCVTVPGAGLGPADLAERLLVPLCAGPVVEPCGLLAAFGAHLAEQSQVIGIVVDDAHRLPSETVRWLGDCVSASKGALRLGLAGDGDDWVGRILDASGLAIDVVRLEKPLDPAEARRFAECWIRGSGGPARWLDALSKENLALWLALSNGLPAAFEAVMQTALLGASLSEPAAIPATDRDSVLETHAAPVEAPGFLRSTTPPRAGRAPWRPGRLAAAAAAVVAAAVVVVAPSWQRSPPDLSVTPASQPAPVVPSEVAARSSAVELEESSLALAAPEVPAPAAPEARGDASPSARSTAELAHALDALAGESQALGYGEIIAILRRHGPDGMAVERLRELEERAGYGDALENMQWARARARMRAALCTAWPAAAPRLGCGPVVASH
jgi:hypothetical protein